MTQQDTAITIGEGIIQKQLELFLECRAELLKSFEMHMIREDFLKSYPKQTEQVKKAIGVAKFHKIATAKYADVSFSLVQNLISENQSLRKKLK